MTPLQRYNNQIASGLIKQDILQNEAVLCFEDLYQQITNPKKTWYFKSVSEFHGLYIYGSVGRGKTFLMDLFVETLDKNIIYREHFHAFMSMIHQSLRKIKNQQNPIDIVIKNLSESIKIICLDEFLVHDITDAMLLSSILLALEKHKISLVTTSNINPVDLYHGGLQRKKFIPAIHWMQKNMKILQLDGEYDYRGKSPVLNKKWINPINGENQNKFEQLYSHKIMAEKIHISPITINKRILPVIKRSKNHIMFEFDTLCRQPRNASDFMLISQQYDSIFAVINTAIEKDDRNTAKRFITLIDVLYDQNTPLYILSTCHFNGLYSGTDLAFEMQRTISRLNEMQSWE